MPAPTQFVKFVKTNVTKRRCYVRLRSSTRATQKSVLLHPIYYLSRFETADHRLEPSEASRVRINAWADPGQKGVRRLKTPTIREAVAVFDDPQKLEIAVSELQSCGIDRANLSFVAPAALAERYPASTRGLADDPSVAREAVVTEPDLRQGRVLGTSMAATIAAFAATGFTVATGGSLAAVMLAGAAAAAASGAVTTAIGRKLAKDEETFLDAQLAQGGVLLWVRTPDADSERRAAEVLRRHSRHFHLHDMPPDPMRGS